MTNDPFAAQHAPTPLDQTVLERLLAHPRGRELLALYAEDARDMLRQLREALSRSDAAATREAAHSLKGSSQYVGASRIVSLSAALEQQAREGLRFDTAELMAQLEIAFAHVSRAITTVVQPALLSDH